MNFAEYIKVVGEAPIGPPPGIQTFYTLGVVIFVAAIASISKTVDDNHGVVPRLGVLLSRLGLGIVAGVILPLFIGDLKPIGFGTAIVLGGIGGALGFRVIKAIANVLGGKWGVKIEDEGGTANDTEGSGPGTVGKPDTTRQAEPNGT